MKKEMLINVLQPEECRIAIVEDGVLEELYVERTSHESYTGNIYKGRIVNLEPAIQAAFVDFSVGRNGFLHVSDVEASVLQPAAAHGVDDTSRPGRCASETADRDHAPSATDTGAATATTAAGPRRTCRFDRSVRRPRASPRHRASTIDTPKGHETGSRRKAADRIATATTDRRASGKPRSVDQGPARSLRAPATPLRRGTLSQPEPGPSPSPHRSTEPVAARANHLSRQTPTPQRASPERPVKPGTIPDWAETWQGESRRSKLRGTTSWPRGSRGRARTIPPRVSRPKPTWSRTRGPSEPSIPTCLPAALSEAAAAPDEPSGTEGSVARKPPRP